MKKLLSFFLTVVLCTTCLFGVQVQAAETEQDHQHLYTVVSCDKANAGSKTNGKITKRCQDCGDTIVSTLYYPKTVTLSAVSYTYDGKAKKPSVTVKDSKGNKIGAKNYTVSYSGGRKNVGKYTVTVKFKGNYSGTLKTDFTIKPKGTTISKLTAGVKKFTVKWKKQSSQTTGYQIQYSTTSKFKKAKTVTVGKKSATSKTISKLNGKKKYYVRIRTYKTVNVNGKSTKIYSSWSKVKSITTKNASASAKKNASGASSSSKKGTASNSATVYVTPTGKRYHRISNCGNGTYTKSTLSAAKARGLTPCQKCW